MDLIEWLQCWYNKNCDGDWEHVYGVVIETLDNPGWHVKIDLAETKYLDISGHNFEEDKGDNDWIRCTIENEVFHGFGDCQKLIKIIETFRKWIEKQVGSK
ncbi:immunity 53 family protein [Lacrimispora sp.]|uniref:immunity 53 family protein n=1 Tax=Lacrimispora sp. TaxID=2719234 RepID=UPI0028623112|nr:immunity 53 family protein [Lacrimispora sp.]MDR7814700.1 immunity 53 family protein [Lacrimispora sp.]